tara:strand:- start:52 stop:231 length:180 start_codon:yes stop_codon:yes gene_type:complete
MKNKQTIEKKITKIELLIDKVSTLCLEVKDLINDDYIEKDGEIEEDFLEDDLDEDEENE